MKPAWILVAIVIIAIVVIFTVGPFNSNPTGEQASPHALDQTQ
jgi:hypothetical protein